MEVAPDDSGLVCVRILGKKGTVYSVAVADVVAGKVFPS